MAQSFGGEARLQLCDDDDSDLTLGLVSSLDRPQPGYRAYGTAGLSLHPLQFGGEEFPVRVELLGVSYHHEDNFGLFLAEVGFSIIHKGEMVHPGECLPAAVQSCYPATTVPHLFLTNRHAWPETLDVEEFHGHDIAWLWALPISQPERALLEKQGAEALENLLLRQGGSVDLYRASLV